jgi:DnaJ-like protein
MNPNRLSRRAVEIVAENRIREFMEQERFEDLAGFGRPIADVDEPYDPDWWVKKWIRRERISRTLAERFGKDFWARG